MELQTSLLIKSDWSLIEDAIVIFCASENEARNRVLDLDEYEYWAKLAYSLRVPEARLYYPKSKKSGKYFQILATQNETKEKTKMTQYKETGIFPILSVDADIPLTPAIRRALDTIAENPDERWVLLKLGQNLESQVQVAMTKSMQVCIVGTTVKQALNRDRKEYFLLEDLEKIKTLTRQNEQFETCWRGYSPVTKSNWREFRYHYQTIETIQDTIWQLGKNLDTPISIESPLVTR